MTRYRPKRALFGTEPFAGYTDTTRTGMGNVGRYTESSRTATNLLDIKQV